MSDSVRRALAVGMHAVTAGLVCLVCLPAAVSLAPASAMARVTVAKVHYACSSPKSATAPCHFSTPSGNIRCLWTPVPNSVACERVATRRGYRLRPTGKAKAIVLKLAHRGTMLPTSQQIVFPGSLSCHDTSTTMTCNQDFGLGGFKLAPKGSHAS